MMEVLSTVWDGYIAPFPKFWCVAVLFTYIGRYMARRVFTEERAKQVYPNTPHGRRMRWTFVLGYETLAMHPVLAGAVLGLLWRDPEGRSWGTRESVIYFALAGAVGMLLWLGARTYAAAKGYKLPEPGDSDPPAPIELELRDDEDEPTQKISTRAPRIPHPLPPVNAARVAEQLAGVPKVWP